MPNLVYPGKEEQFREKAKNYYICMIISQDQQHVLTRIQIWTGVLANVNNMYYDGIHRLQL